MYIDSQPPENCPLCEESGKFEEITKEELVSKPSYPLKEADFREDNWTKKQLFGTEQIRVETYYFKKGQVLQMHKHSGTDQAIFFQKGEFLATIEEEESETVYCPEQTVLLVPMGTWHEIECASEEGVFTQISRVPVETTWKDGSAKFEEK